MKKKMKADLHGKEIGELRKLVKEARQDLFTMTIDHSQYKLKNTRGLFNKKKEIAVLQTILRGKELSGDRESR